MTHMLGIDLGGTDIKSALITKDGSQSETRSTPTPQADPSGESAINRLSEIILEYARDHSFEGVGLAVPGLVDNVNGIGLYSGTLGWRDLPIVSALEEKTCKKVTLEHDVTAIGHAENRIGEAKDVSSAVVVAIGTAIAASVIIDGEVYHPHPAVGEIGHTPTGNDRPCVCGLTGCLEMPASGGAISRNYKALTGEKISALDIFNLASKGEAQASELVNEFMDTLSTALVFVSALIGPDVIVVSGGVSKAGEDFVGDLQKALDKKLSIHKRPLLRLSKLQAGAGAIGAGLLGWERLT